MSLQFLHKTDPCEVRVFTIELGSTTGEMLGRGDDRMRTDAVTLEAFDVFDQH